MRRVLQMPSPNLEYLSWILNLFCRQAHHLHTQKITSLPRIHHLHVRYVTCTHYTSFQACGCCCGVWEFGFRDGSRFGRRTLSRMHEPWSLLRDMFVEGSAFGCLRTLKKPLAPATPGTEFQQDLVTVTQKIWGQQIFFHLQICCRQTSSKQNNLYAGLHDQACGPWWGLSPDGGFGSLGRKDLTGFWGFGVAGRWVSGWSH